jgi:hypothetical protein
MPATKTGTAKMPPPAPVNPITAPIKMPKARTRVIDLHQVFCGFLTIYFEDDI